MDSQQQKQTLDGPEDRLQTLTDDNLQLRDKNERLLIKVGYLESRLGHLTSSHADLSGRLVRSEEDNLKISKELVEEKLQTNRIREKFEEETFELKNKILNQAGVITELEMEQEKLSRALQSAEAHLKVGEKSGQDLMEEHAALKKSYLTLSEAHRKELAQSEELGAELLALARAQDALRRQVEEQQESVNTTTRGLHGELERVKALISRMSHNRVKLEDLEALDKEQKTLEKTLIGNQDELKDMLEQMKSSYEEQQRKLEEKVAAMGEEQQENRRAIRESQQKLSAQSAALLCSQSQAKEVEEDNSKLQLQVKELNEEYRERLVSYLQDISEHIDRFGEGKSSADASKMRVFVDRMLQDVRSSHRVREEQLASAARRYKKRLQRTMQAHHALLKAYRIQREQILLKPECSLDPGPPDSLFILEPTEPRDETERESQPLHEETVKLQGSGEQGAVFRLPVQNEARQGPSNLQQICEESWSDKSRQLRQITDSTLVDLEEERALLITRATAAEAQVSELQDYINNHLGRYREEISRLCSLHGKQVAGRSQSARSTLR
ncbi:coiled-coil domain-containing protein 78 [Halichoeres trimaculatus]|uniref:coiled-coil domain-containing protein 78 n=1 Tax=Halichoeres trimaculatus TaxID=147232 RepID=UPI003D9EBF23